MTAATALIDVVILTWNDAEQARDAIASALASAGVEVRVFVVDNGSVPPFAATPGATVVRSETNLGVGGGRNRGAGEGQAPLVCFLDSDAVLRPGCLAALAACMAPDVAVTVPVFADQDPRASAGRAPGVGRKLLRALDLTTLYAPKDQPGPSAAWDVDFGIGACQLVRREALDAVGGIDDSDPFGPEDVDLCLRIRDAGWRVVQVAAATCEHPPRRAHRRLMSRRGRRHALAIARYLVRRRLGGAGRRR